MFLIVLESSCIRHPALRARLAEGSFRVRKATPRMFFVSQFRHAALVGQFDRVIDRGHPFDDASKVNPAFARIQPRVAGQLDHPFTRVRDARQAVRDVQEVKQFGRDVQKLAQIDAAEVQIERIHQNATVRPVRSTNDIQRFVQCA